MSRRNGNGAVSEIEPMRLDECPVHGELVLVTPRGRFIRRCQECVDEAARGLRILAEIAERKRLEGGAE